MTDDWSHAVVSGDDEALGEFLRTNRLAVILVERDGVQVPAVLEDSQGRHSLAAFSSQVSFRLWKRPELVAMVPGAELPRLAAQQGVDQVLVDAAGPVPAAFPPQALQALVDGLAPESDGSARLHGTQAFRQLGDRPLAERIEQTVRANFSERVVAFVLERLVGEQAVPTVAVFGPDLAIADLAHAISTTSGAVVDVIALDEPTFRRFDEQFAGCRIA